MAARDDGRAEPVELLLAQLAPSLRRHHEELARQVGLREVELACLEIADRPRGIGMTALAERLGRSPAATTAIVDRLVDAGLVSRWADPLDRRRQVVGTVTSTVTGTAPDARGPALGGLVADLVREQVPFSETELVVVSRWVYAMAQALARRAGDLAMERDAQQAAARRAAGHRR